MLEACEIFHLDFLCYRTNTIEAYVEHAFLVDVNKIPQFGHLQN